jgi:hypothetical protein
MLVSTTCLVFIVLGLTAMFIETQRVFKAGTKQVSMTDSGRTVLDMVASDLAQVSDAQNPYVTNLFWSWSPTNTSVQIADGSTVPFRTNQLQMIFMLVHTNLQWVGVGYAVSNAGGGAGTLYRYQASTNDPLTFASFWPIYTNFTLNASNGVFNPAYFHRVTDGVVHLKIRAYDQTGNEPLLEQQNDFNPYGDALSYPASGYFYTLGTGQSNYVSSAALPASVQLEVGVLEPDAYEQLRALPHIANAQNNFMAKAGGKIQIYRQNIPIVGAIQ